MSFTWFDAYGRKVEIGRLREEQAAPATRAVRQTYANHPAAGLTPGKLAALLRDSIDGDPEAYLELAEDMEERDLHYAGVLTVRKRQVAGLEVSVEAAGDDKAAQKAADLVRRAIERDGFEDELSDMLDAIGKGFSHTEIIWDRSGREWGIERLARRDPRLFRFDDETGERPLLRDLAGDAELAPFKWVSHYGKAKSGLPIRGGLARAVAWTFLFKAYTTKDWAIFTEAYAQPFRLGKFHNGASEKDKATLLDAVRSIGVDFAAVIPAEMAVEFIKADVTGTHELYEKRADWLDRQISKVVLGQTATTDAIAGGHAVGKTHDNVRKDIERSDARQIAATLNRDLVRPLVQLNHGPDAPLPRIRIGRPEQTDVKALTENVAKLVPLGLRVGQRQMRERIGLEDPADDDELLGAPARAEPPAEKPKTDPAAAVAALSTLSAGDADAIDRAVVGLVADEWHEAEMDGIADGLSGLVARAGTPEEARAAIAGAIDRIDLDRLRELVGKAMFAAWIAGRLETKG